MDAQLCYEDLKTFPRMVKDKNKDKNIKQVLISDDRCTTLI